MRKPPQNGGRLGLRSQFLVDIFATFATRVRARDSSGCDCFACPGPNPTFERSRRVILIRLGAIFFGHIPRTRICRRRDFQCMTNAALLLALHRALAPLLTRNWCRKQRPRLRCLSAAPSARSASRCRSQWTAPWHWDHWARFFRPLPTSWRAISNGLSPAKIPVRSAHVGGSLTSLEGRLFCVKITACGASGSKPALECRQGLIA